jgi:hypothetical protein
MRSRRAVVLLALFAAAAARADDLQLATGALLYESGQLAPVVEFRSIAEDGAMWRGGVNGWALNLARERPVDRGRRMILEITATPYDAHSSRRVYRNGVRAQELELDDAAITLRAAMRIRQGEHAWIEPAFVIGDEHLGSAAPASLRRAWRAPYAGIAATERIRFVTADDPLLGRIDGIEAAATGEAYRGNRLWTRAIVTESGGVSRGRLHLRQTLAAFGGNGLDSVNAFLVGGSWDALGALAVYGRRYAEFRARRGIIANASADVAVSRGTDLGIRTSAFRGDGTRARGVMLIATTRAAGMHVSAGVARSQRRTTVSVTVACAMFRR